MIINKLHICNMNNMCNMYIILYIDRNRIYIYLIELLPYEPIKSASR